MIFTMCAEKLAFLYICKAFGFRRRNGDHDNLYAPHFSFQSLWQRKWNFEIKQNMSSFDMILINGIFYVSMFSLMSHIPSNCLYNRRKLNHFNPVLIYGACPLLSQESWCMLRGISSQTEMCQEMLRYSFLIKRTFSKKDLFSSNGVMECTSLRRKNNYIKKENQSDEKIYQLVEVVFVFLIDWEITNIQTKFKCI